MIIMVAHHRSPQDTMIIMVAHHRSPQDTMIITILICVTIIVPTPPDEVSLPLLQGTTMDHHSTIITIHGVVLLIMILLYSYVGILLEIDRTMILHTLTCHH